jgi:hypothetical protein
MSTRGFIGFVVDGTEKIAYNHSDSYPEGLGRLVLDWLRTAQLDDVRRLAAALRVVGPKSTPTADDIERLRPYANPGVATGSLDDWYVLLHATQGNPAAILDAGVIEDASSFPADSLYAEWGYLVDLDTGVFEVYRGFQETPHRNGRFADRPTRIPPTGYQPCALVASWKLDALPTDEAFEATLGALDGADL